MTTALGWIALLAALPGSLELLLVTLGALLPRRRAAPGAPPRTSVVIPAHDEEGTIARAVRSVRASDPGVDVVVVADNCTDATAERAAAAGARVLVRRDPERRGKPHALRCAFDALLAAPGTVRAAPAATPASSVQWLDEAAARATPPPDAVAVIDADTVVGPGFVATVTAELAAGADAVQVRYGVLNPHDSLRTTLLAVAFMAFNHLRPRGRDRLGLSAGLLGNGFAVRRETLAAVPLESRSITEDLHYHLALVAAGRRVRFTDATAVLADMPVSRGGLASQRERWEGGRLHLARQHVPALARAVLRGRLRLAEPLLELLTLPLALHVVVLMGAWVLLPAGAPRLAAVCALGIVVLHVAVALRIGRAGRRELASLALAPVHVLWKLARTPAIARAARRDAAWVRTARDEPRDRTSRTG